MKWPIIFLIFLFTLPAWAIDKPLFRTTADVDSQKNFENIEYELNKLYNGKASLEVSSVVSSLETIALLDATSLEADGAFITTLTATDITAETIVVNTDIYTKDWTDYGSTSTIVGFSGTPTVNIWYKKVGDLVSVDFYFIGVSNATNFSFTLPYTSANRTNKDTTVACAVMDNGTTLTTPGRAYLPTNSNIVTITIDMAQSNLFTASGAKRAFGQFWYEAQ